MPRHSAFQQALKTADPVELQNIVNGVCGHFSENRDDTAKAFYCSGKAFLVARRIAILIAQSNRRFRGSLKGTKSRYIVSCGDDTYWSTGIDQFDSPVHSKGTYPGSNWWGVALMCARSELFPQFSPSVYWTPGGATPAPHHEEPAPTQSKRAR
jgi:hypothetical protein